VDGDGGGGGGARDIAMRTGEIGRGGFEGLEHVESPLARSTATGNEGGRDTTPSALEARTPRTNSHHRRPRHAAAKSQQERASGLQGGQLPEQSEGENSSKRLGAKDRAVDDILSGGADRETRARINPVASATVGSGMGVNAALVGVLPSHIARVEGVVDDLARAMEAAASRGGLNGHAQQVSLFLSPILIFPSYMAATP
jgi:hypothetical protein